MKKNYNKFFIIGAGGYGKQLSVMLNSDGLIEKPIFVDNKMKFNLQKFSKLNTKNYFNIFVGNPTSRENIFKLLKSKKNLKYSTLILSNSTLYTKKIGKGCIIEHYVLLSNDVSIGIGCLVLTGSVVGHNVKIGNFCNIGTNVTVSGNVKIGKRVIVGSQSFISNNIKICDNVILTPGSIVLRNIAKPGTYQGNIPIKS